MDGSLHHQFFPTLSDQQQQEPSPSLSSSFKKTNLNTEIKIRSLDPDDGLFPSSGPALIVSLLKVCTKEKDLQKGHRIFSNVVKRGFFENNIYVGNTLIDMYAKHGLIEEAQNVFDKLPVHDVVSWTALISGYAIHGHGREALKCFEKMQLKGISPNSITFLCIVKACGNIGEVEIAQEIHAEIISQGFLTNNSNNMLGNALIDMYAKCGLIGKSREVFDELPFQDVVSWTTIIAGYVQHGCIDEALTCFNEMQLKGVSPNKATFVCILKACAWIGAGEKGEEIHAMIERVQLLGKNMDLSNALVDMYAKCGLLEKAQKVFNELPNKDIVSWSALIAGYTQHGHGEWALRCFDEMKSEGFSPNSITFISSLKACSSIGALDKGQEIHEEITRRGLLEKDIAIGTSLVDMYAKCGALVKAQELFNALPFRDLILWSTLISGYAQLMHAEEALDCFDQMQLEGFSPDAVTFVSVLKACGTIQDTLKGQEAHAKIVKNGFLENDMVVGNALIDMYADFRMLAEAQKVFDQLSVLEIVSWNALISGYIQNGRVKEALECFEQLKLGGFSPNSATFSSIVKAYGSIGNLNEIQNIHSEIVGKGMLENDIIVGTALVDMYAKCGALVHAQKLFDDLSIRDVVSWSALIAGYAQHQHYEEALSCFDKMQQDGVLPDAVTFVCILQSCGSIGAMQNGQILHSMIIKDELLDNNPVIRNALLDMYAKCGMLIEAREVFDDLPRKDVVSWTLFIAGCAQLGQDDIVLNLLKKMIDKGSYPDSTTFSVVLSTCSHSGLLGKGQILFEMMSTHFDIIPTLEHYNCMVDLFGRAGSLANALTIINDMPIPANATLWHTLLGACRKWGYDKLGRLAFEHAVKLDVNDASAYIYLSNIYATLGMQKSASAIDYEI